MSVVRRPDNPRGLRDLPFAVEQASPNERARARRLAAALAEHYADAYCELDHSNAHELLIATILSAQSTDAGVNKATPGLFRAFRTPGEYAAADPRDIEPYIKTIGLFRNKAKSIQAAMASVCEDFGGEVPGTMDELLTLRGVARKTANVVLGNAFDTNAGFVVDTHVQRLSYRFGLTDDPKLDPKKVEQRLVALFPRDQWCNLSHRMIFHGRRACSARPNCAHDHPICRGFGVNCPKPSRAPQKASKKSTPA
ncbi:MAG: endonuclease III [Planctomycetota bacterium]